MYRKLPAVRTYISAIFIKNEALKQKGGDYILCVDVSAPVLEFMRKIAYKPVYNLTKCFGSYVNSIDRLKLAKAVLFMYHNAHSVITTNLYTALPCLAFETPVCVIEPDNYGIKYEEGRFEGFREMMHFYPQKVFLDNFPYDFNNPPENPEGFNSVRDGLVEKCRNFTGYDSNIPTLEDNYNPTLDLLEILFMSNANIKRVLYWANGKDMLKIVAKKLIYKVLSKLFYTRFRKYDRNDYDQDEKMINGENHDAY